MKNIKNYKTIDDYNIEKDMLVKPNVSLVDNDNSIHYNEDYFEITIESLSKFKLNIYFTKLDYDNNEPSYIFDGVQGSNTVSFNHKIYNIETTSIINSIIYPRGTCFTKVIVKGDIIYPLALFSFFANRNNIVLDFSKLNPTSIITLETMFYSYSRYSEQLPLDVTGLCTKLVTSLNNVFNTCIYLKHITGIGTWDTSCVKTFRNAFNTITSIDNLDDVNLLDTSNCESFAGTFKKFACSKNSINLSNLNTKKAATLNSMFNYSLLQSIYGAENWDVSSCTDFAYMCSYLDTTRVLNYINCSTWNMVNALNCTYMFYNYIGTVLDLSKWSLPKVTDLSGILMNASNLETIDVHNWNPINNKTLFLAFGRNGGTSVPVIMNTKSINISNWDNNELLIMAGTFQYLPLEDINISNFKTPKVTNMDYTFTKCINLKELDLSSMITRYVTTMNGMFKNCISLTKLNICNFDTTSLINNTDMFLNCNSIHEFILGRNFFNSVTITTYSFKDLINWTESLSIANLVDCIPQTTTAKTIVLSPNTSAMLTDSQRAIIVSKNWTISVA